MKICFIDLEITFLLSALRNLVNFASADNRRSVSTFISYINLLYTSNGRGAIAYYSGVGLPEPSEDSTVIVSAPFLLAYGNT